MLAADNSMQNSFSRVADIPGHPIGAALGELGDREGRRHHQQHGEGNHDHGRFLLRVGYIEGREAAQGAAHEAGGDEEAVVRPGHVTDDTEVHKIGGGVEQRRGPGRRGRSRRRDPHGQQKRPQQLSTPQAEQRSNESERRRRGWQPQRLYRSFQRRRAKGALLRVFKLGDLGLRGRVRHGAKAIDVAARIEFGKRLLYDRLFLARTRGEPCANECNRQEQEGQDPVEYRTARQLAGARWSPTAPEFAPSDPPRPAANLGHHPSHPRPRTLGDWHASEPARPRSPPAGSTGRPDLDGLVDRLQRQDAHQHQAEQQDQGGWHQLPRDDANAASGKHARDDLRQQLPVDEKLVGAFLLPSAHVQSELRDRVAQDAGVAQRDSLAHEEIADPHKDGHIQTAAADPRRRRYHSSREKQEDRDAVPPGERRVELLVQADEVAVGPIVVRTVKRVGAGAQPVSFAVTVLAALLQIVAEALRHVYVVLRQADGDAQEQNPERRAPSANGECLGERVWTLFTKRFDALPKRNTLPRYHRSLLRSFHTAKTCHSSGAVHDVLCDQWTRSPHPQKRARAHGDFLPMRARRNNLTRICRGF
eukprot:scaffold504_cov240-Pinguiococcus_pyrenoidosus.AAC.10